jgi:hypothetical protein
MAFRVMPHAVLGFGALTATLPTASAAIGASMPKDGDSEANKDLHQRLRSGTEDGDKGWKFGRFFRALEGKKVAEKEDVSFV